MNRIFGKIKKVLFAQAVLAVTTVFAPGTACAKIDPYAGLSMELSEVPASLSVGETAEITATLVGDKSSTVLAEEPWDYISLQQASGFSGKYETCSSYLPEILNYVRARSKYDVKLIWHSTWAYAANSTHSDFPKYNSNQMTMFNAIVDVAQKVMENSSYSFDLLVPSGTAIQNGRTSSLGDTFNRDGYHLEVTYGRYTAACTWFEAISGKNVKETSYVPSSMNEIKAKIARSAAHNAVCKPYKVTDMSK